MSILLYKMHKRVARLCIFSHTFSIKLSNCQSDQHKNRLNLIVYKIHQQ